VGAGYVFLRLLGRTVGELLGLLSPSSETGPAPAAGLILLSLASSFVVAVAGGHVCARLARRAELPHAAVLAGLLALGRLALLAGAPAGYPRALGLAEVAVDALGVLLGGFIRARARAD
jgi:hypothetical protein